MTDLRDIAGGIAAAAPAWRPARGPRAGQSLIEACLAVGILCLIFMGFFQVAQIMATRQVLYHAAARGARAKMVGFNRFMVGKSVRVATIPNAGRPTLADMEHEDETLRDWMRTETPGGLWDRVLGADPAPSASHEIERARIPYFMAAPRWNEAYAILDYEHWNTIRDITPGAMDDGAPLRVRVRQALDLRRLFGASLHSAFYAEDILDLEGRATLEAHYPLYIDDRNW